MADDFESLVIRKESGGRPYIGWGETDLTPYIESGNVTKYGFPNWPGKPGPAGNSTAAGLYGITGTNWNKYAPALGVSDFTPASQKKVYDAVLADQGEGAWRPYWTGGGGGGSRRPEGSYGGALHLNVGGREGPGEAGVGDTLTGLALLSSITGSRYAEDQQPPGTNDLLASLLAGAQGSPPDGGKPPQGSQAPQPEQAPPAPPETPLPANLFDQGNVDTGSPSVPSAAAPPHFDQGEEAPAGGNALLSSILSGGDPEAAGAVASSQAMQPAVERVAGDVRATPSAGEQIVASGQREQEVRNRGGSLLEQIMASGDSPFAQGFQPGVIGGMTRRLPPRGEPPPIGAVDRSFVERRGEQLSAEDAAVDREFESFVRDKTSVENRDTIATATDNWRSPSPQQEFIFLNQGGFGPWEPNWPGRYLHPEYTNVTSGDAYEAAGSLWARTKGYFNPDNTLTRKGQKRWRELAASGGGGPAQPPVGALAAGTPGTQAPLPAAGLLPTPLAGGGGRMGGPPAVPPGISGVPARGTPEGGGGSQPPMMPREMVGAETAAERPVKAGDPNESGPVKALRLEAMRSTQDKLWKHWQVQNEYIDRQLNGLIEAMREAKMSPEERLQIERYMEWQPGMPQVAINGKAKRIADEILKPSRERTAADYAYLKSEGALDLLPEDYLQEMTEGYLHRMRQTSQARHPFEPFAGVRGLRQSTTSMKKRQTYALQSGNERKVVVGDVPGAYGSKIEQGGKEWEIRRATMEEVEKHTDIRYVHNPMLATFQNEAQLHLARENFDLLRKTIMPQLVEDGLATTSARAATAGRSRETQYVGSINPATRGWYFEPRIAAAFDDFYRAPSIVTHNIEDAANRLMAVNRFALNALFLNPFPHMRNVWSDYKLARAGGPLFQSPGSTMAMMRHLRAAYGDVIENSSFYNDVRRANGALMGASSHNRILYNAMMKKARQEMVNLPELEQFVRRTGVWRSLKEMGEDIYNKSQEFMWGFHDMLLLARVRELQATKKLGIETAVKEAERFIADYRVPATIGEDSLRLGRPTARVLSQIMQDRSTLWFGRYHYNKLRGLANTIGDTNRLMRGRVPEGERVEVLKRMGYLLFVSTIAAPAVTYLLREATGDPKAKYHVPGMMGIGQNVGHMALDVARGDIAEFGSDFLKGMLSIISPAPLLMELGAQAFNRNYPGGPPITYPNEPPGRAAVKRLGHAAKSFVPPIGTLTDPRKAINELTGISP